MSRLPGANAADAVHKDNLSRLMRQIGLGLKSIHDVDIADCAFLESLDVKIAEAERRVRANAVDTGDFDPVRQGQSAEALLERLLSLRPNREDLVFTHGDYCLPNIIIRDGRVGGFVDWGRAGVADRYQDLALAIRSIRYNFGNEWVPYFIEAYGIEQADEDKVDYYQLLDEFF